MQAILVLLLLSSTSTWAAVRTGSGESEESAALLLTGTGTGIPRAAGSKLPEQKEGHERPLTPVLHRRRGGAGANVAAAAAAAASTKPSVVVSSPAPAASSDSGTNSSDSTRPRDLPRVQAAAAAKLPHKKTALPLPVPPPSLDVGYRRPGPGSASRQVNVDDLKPTKERDFRRDYYYQIPAQPRAVALMIHGCAHAARNFWPQSATCPECRGMPEQLSHTLQAMQRGYAVISVNSLNASTGCWSWQDDKYDVPDLMERWLKKHGLQDLPLYGLGVSSGSAFTLKLPRYLQFSGILSEALAVTVESWGLEKVPGAYPPTVFASMVRDESMAVRITAAWEELKERKSPVEIIAVHPRVVYPNYFSDRFSSKISTGLSKKLTAGLQRIKMIDKAGTVLEDPRYTDRPWLSMLQKEVPELARGSIQKQGSKALPGWPENEDVLLRGVWSLLNLAYANHEIVSDYCTAAFIWFESLGKSNLAKLVEQHTYGLPPPGVRTPAAGRQRSAMEVAAGDAAARETAYLATAVVGAGVLSEAELRRAAERARAHPEVLLGGAELARAELADLQYWRGAVEAVPADAAMEVEGEATAGAAATGAAVAGWQAAVGRVGGSDEELFRAAKELQASLGLTSGQNQGLNDVLHGDDEAAADSWIQAPSQRPSSYPSGAATAANTLVGGLLAGAAAGLLLAGLVVLLVRRRRASSQVGGLLAGTVQSGHLHPAPASRLSIIPGVKERFADLTEVVEASGSPYSARRRIKTAFSESPHRSPQKNGGFKQGAF